MTKLHKLSPILWTNDLEATISFYGDVLGFRGQSHFPNFVSLLREDVEIMFVVPQDEPGECKESNQEESFFREPCLTGSLFISIDDVDELWASIKDRVVIKSTLADRQYLMRDFSILDNNGYELVFGQDISNTKRH